MAKTYNTRDSLVVTDPTTSLALTGLSMGERTGSRILQWVWPYVAVCEGVAADVWRTLAAAGALHHYLPGNEFKAVKITKSSS